MKHTILLFVLTVVTSSVLTGCDRATSNAQAQKEKQQEAKDRDVLKGKFEKSPGKSY